MNPDYIINSIKQISDIHYRNGEAADRLAYQVGMLEQKIREISALHEERIAFMNKEIEHYKSLVK